MANIYSGVASYAKVRFRFSEVAVFKTSKFLECSNPCMTAGWPHEKYTHSPPSTTGNVGSSAHRSNKSQLFKPSDSPSLLFFSSAMKSAFTLATLAAIAAAAQEFTVSPDYNNSTTTIPVPPGSTDKGPNEGKTTTIPVPPGSTDKGPNEGKTTTIPVPPGSTDKGPNEGKTETVPGPIQYTTTTIECPVCEGGFSTTTIPVPPGSTDKGPNEGETKTIPVPPGSTDKGPNEGKTTTIPVPPGSTDKGPNEGKTETVPGPIQYTTTTIECPVCEGGFSTTTIPVPPGSTDKGPNEGETKTIPVPPGSTDKSPNEGKTTTIPVPPGSTDKGPNEGKTTTIPVPPGTTDKVPPPAPTTLADISRQPEPSSTGVIVTPQVEEANGAAKFGVGAAAAIAAMAMIV
ncbi:hypothetical protein DIRU0_D04258 [Diutina rugosa]